MSAAAEPEKKPPGIFRRFFGAIAAGPRKLFGLSLPAKAALFVLFVLMAVVLTAWIAFLIDPASIPWRHSMTAGRITAVLCLLVLIPIVLHRSLKLWLEGESSQFPDIDFAWRAGIAALRDHGIDLTTTPVFLVLGSSGEQQERDLMTASNLSLRVREVPEGPSPLHWFANPDGVFLFCSDTSWLSALSTLQRTRKTEDVARALPDLEGPQDARGGEAIEMQAPAALSPVGFGAPAVSYPSSQAGYQAAPVESGRDPNRDSKRGTIMLDSYMATALAGGGNPTSGNAPAAQTSGGAVYTGSAANLQAAMAMEEAGNNRGTIMLQAPLAAAPHAVPQTGAAPNSGVYDSGTYTRPNYAQTASTGGSLGGGQRTAALLPPQESGLQLRRLKYVCQLLRRARQPLCAANGVLTLLPFELIAAGSRESNELQQAAKSDLQVVQRTLELQCPITALVVGLENESGFRELVRRVGRERSGVQRFGQRYDVRSVATAEELASLCAHVCGTFEDWVYTLFREQGALSRPGNTRLYSLLCKVRTHLKGRLSDVLAKGYGHELIGSDSDALFFSGCYFAATGESEDRQAFVAGVLQKLMEEQEEIEWTRRAVTAERRWRALAMVGLALDGILLLTLVGMVIYKLFGW